MDEVGKDGVITVDNPPEESGQFVQRLNEEEIDSIFLLSPTTEDERIKLIAKQASGFLYYVSLKGVTGAANIDIEQVKKDIQSDIDGAYTAIELLLKRIGLLEDKLIELGHPELIK